MRYLPKEVILTLDQLKELCKEWQETLRLQDFDFIIEIVEAHNLGSCTALSTTDLKNKWVYIRFVKPEHYRVLDRADPYDMELSLVHELGHVHYRMAGRADGECSEAEECMIERYAQALVALLRAASPPSLDGHRDMALDAINEATHAGVPI